MHTGTGYTNFCVNMLMLMVLFLVSAASAAEVSDREVTMAVENRIRKDPGASLNDLDVETSDGIVTLRGTVSNVLAKNRSVKVTGTVKGVRSVVDLISVTPPPRADSAIKKDIEQSLNNDPLSDSWEITLAVNDGEVILSGAVDSQAEREIIERKVMGVKGVVSVTNKLIISYESSRSDAEMQEEIERRLFWNAMVDASHIDVEVEDNRAALSGTVGSAAERSEAHRNAWVAGIESVDSSNLDVDWWAREENLRSGKYQVRDNKAVEKAIQDAFRYDPRVDMFEIIVDVNEGWVTLKGTVDNLRAKRAAARDARNTVGVWHVRNLIKVRPGAAEDKVIADAVRNAFRMDPNVDRYEIAVTVRDGDVYLSGSVDSYHEKAQADHIASGIRGVREVKNRLRVELQENITHSPHVDPWYTYEYDWYRYPDAIPVKPDPRIQEEIEQELFWSPFVDSDEISVEVDKGFATLSGSVDSWSEYNAAIENALQGGAIGVDAELEVKDR